MRSCFPQALFLRGNSERKQILSLCMLPTYLPCHLISRDCQVYQSRLALLSATERNFRRVSKLLRRRAGKKHCLRWERQSKDYKRFARVIISTWTPSLSELSTHRRSKLAFRCYFVFWEKRYSNGYRVP